MTFSLEAGIPAPAPVTEVTPILAPARPAATPVRAGYDSDVPVGGATAFNPGGDYENGRAETMRQFYSAYTSCPWVSAPVDVIARTVTAGGLHVVPDDELDAEHPPPPVQQLQALLDYVNPHEDVRQLLRGVITDAEIYGDSFTEIVVLFGKPVALYSLDAATMSVDADEHGQVTGYTQTLGYRTATFSPEQIIHVSKDAPRGSLYGIGTCEKAYLPVLVWLFTAGLLKETMRKGNPLNLHVGFGVEHQDSDIRLWRQQHMIRNVGIGNIGTPITTHGDTTVAELNVGKIADYLAVLDQQRDVILSAAGVPPSKVGVIESGNLGGGTGSSQDKTFRVNTCGPVGEIVLEKFNFTLLSAFSVDGWKMHFGTVDWRDDKVVEDIRDMRLKNGSWCVDPETEIRTVDGWKTYTELAVGDTVLTLNHVSGQSEWQPVRQVAIFDLVDAPMAQMTSRSHSSLTTTNHRWPVLRQVGNATKPRTRSWTTSDSMHVMDQIITAAPSGDRPVEARYDDALVELVAWFWTEGHNPPGSKFLLITQIKEDGRDRIRAALEKFYGPAYEAGGHRHRLGCNGAWIERKRDFRIASPHALEILQHIEADDHAVKSDFLLDLTQEQLELFIEVSLMADGVNSKLAGKTGQRVLGQKRQRASEQFQFACILAGVPAHMRVRVRNDVDGRPNAHEAMHVVNVGTTGTVQPKRYSGYEEINYTGQVWCPVTENQSWLARRDGKLFYTGNTLNRYRQEIDEPDVGPEGDNPALILTRIAMLWRDMDAMSTAEVDALAGKGADVLPIPPADPQSGAALPTQPDESAEYTMSIAEKVRNHILNLHDDNNP